MSNDSLNIGLGNYGIAPLTYFSAVMCIILLYFCVNRMEKILKIKKSLDELSVIITTCIVYICLNHPVLNITKNFLFLIGIVGDLIAEYIALIMLKFAISVLILSEHLYDIFYGGENTDKTEDKYIENN